MSRIYIYFLQGLRSGGPEALHQLCERLRAEGHDAVLVPTPNTRSSPRVHAYEHYDVEYEDKVSDASSAVVIVPEIAISLLRFHPAAKKYVWWLSIDFSPVYEARMIRQRGELDHRKEFVRRLKMMSPRSNVLRVTALKSLMSHAEHLCQSHYALDFLLRHEGIEGKMLSDYTTLPENRGPQVSVRDSAIAYNPAKGAELTALVQKRLPEVGWRPLVGMSHQQVSAVLNRTLVYMDLGHHPGKDRIPREAAVAGAVVLVAARGSAANALDVPLPDQFKVPMDGRPDQVADAAAARLKTVLSDASSAVELQRAYRRVITQEREVFAREVRQIFGAAQ